MSSPINILEARIEALSIQTIPKALEDLSSQEIHLATFNFDQGLAQDKVIFIWNHEQNQVQALLCKGEEKIELDLNDLEGIPKECFQHKNKMAGFLANAQVRLSSYLEQNDLKFKIHVTLGLKGGGNIGLGLHHWPVVNEGGRNKFLIPYTLMGSENAANIKNGKDSLAIRRLKQEIAAGHHPKIEAELRTIDAIQSAIRKWNETGLVKLVHIGSEQSNYSDWINFETNSLGYCEAPCIGRCTPSGAHTISCDLEGAFFSSREQSMLHEIGHILGLRHEHMRSDNKHYILTNFVEDNLCKPIGKYDFWSVMHYEIGNFGNKFIKLNDAFVGALIEAFGNRAEEVITKLKDRVGKKAEISEGDKEAVNALIKIALEKERELAAARKAQQEAEKKAKQEAERQAKLQAMRLQRQREVEANRRAEERRKQEARKREAEIKEADEMTGYLAQLKFEENIGESHGYCAGMATYQPTDYNTEYSSGHTSYQSTSATSNFLPGYGNHTNTRDADPLEPYRRKPAAPKPSRTRSKDYSGGW